jgi:MFS family permease
VTRGYRLTVLRHHDFRWFFTADAVNRLGSSMTPVALAFAVLHINNSAGALSRVLAGYVTAQVLFVLVGGLVADRRSRTLALQGSYVFAAATQATVGAFLLTGRATVGSLLVLGAVNGAAAAFAMPAAQGVVPQLVARADLQQANAVLAFSRRGAMVLGPAAAGVLVATAGPGWAILADATGYALGALALTRVRLPTPEPRQDLAADATGGKSLAASASDRAGVPSPWIQLRHGWAEVRERTWLWVIIAVFGVANAIHAGAWAVLGPVIANNSPALGPRGWGLVVSAEAVGAIVMTVLLMHLPLNRPLRQGMVGVAVMAMPLWLLGVRPETLVIGLGAFVAGAGTEVFGTGWNVALMEQIPQDALSRVASYDMLGSFLAIPAGTLLYGWLASTANLETVLIVSAVVYAVVSLATLFVPGIWGLQRMHDSRAAPAEGLALEGTPAPDA